MILAIILCVIGITGFTLIAFGNASQSADRFSDETLHRIDHGDLRLADLLNSSFHISADSE